MDWVKTSADSMLISYHFSRHRIDYDNDNGNGNDFEADQCGNSSGPANHPQSIVHREAVQWCARDATCSG
jgi:hypothetical protein